MGLLDQLSQAVNQAAQATSNANQTDWASLLSPLLAQFGGVQGLVQQLQQGQLGDAVSSWLGQGDNQAISGAQLQQALGEDSLSQLASQTGQPVSGLSDQLAQVLPGLIDQLSPSGQLNAGGLDLGNLGGLLGGLFNKG